MKASRPFNRPAVGRGWTFLAFVAVVGFAPTAQSGEWMFRLRDAHVQLRRALSEGDANAAWEAVDRETRQRAGLLAARIRTRFDELPADRKESLREALGVRDDERLRSTRARDLLVAPFFLEAHPELLVGDPDDERLKDHGTRMAGPTGIVVAKNTPAESLVPYRFTVEAHFGGQAMDYRAQLKVPSLESVLGPAPEPATLPPEEMARQSVAVFERARRALAEEDVATFWELLDCDSQSQANHFADQARERARKGHEAEIAAKLGLDVEQISKLDGPSVWLLSWASKDLAPFVDGTDATYRPAEAYERERVLVPEGYRHKGRPIPEPVVEFRSSDREWQIPVRVNYRDGAPATKLALRPPFYHRLRR